MRGVASIRGEEMPRSVGLIAFGLGSLTFVFGARYVTMTEISIVSSDEKMFADGYGRIPQYDVGPAA